MIYHHNKLYDSAEEFVDFFLRNSWFRTLNRFQANLLGRGSMIFRGQSNSAWSLIPKAFREGELRNFTPQPPIESLWETNPRLYLGRHLHAEGRAVFIFLEAADRMGLPSPIDYTTTRDGLELLEALHNDDDNFDYGRLFPERSYERATALAQHHGVPTRFMDWSESPLVACYFAAIGVSSVVGKKPEPDQEIAVYFISINDLTRDGSPIQVVTAPCHENSFLRQQQGLFTNQLFANKHLLDTGVWPSLEVSAAGKVSVNRARLPAAMADDLLRVLFDMGVHRQSLMPSMENAAATYAYVHALFGNQQGFSISPSVMAFLEDDDRVVVVRKDQPEE